jgi:hypothetical protein
MLIRIHTITTTTTTITMMSRPALNIHGRQTKDPMNTVMIITITITVIITITIIITITTTTIIIIIMIMRHRNPCHRQLVVDLFIFRYQLQ